MLPTSEEQRARQLAVQVDVVRRECVAASVGFHPASSRAGSTVVRGVSVLHRRGGGVRVLENRADAAR